MTVCVVVVFVYVTAACVKENMSHTGDSGQALRTVRASGNFCGQISLEETFLSVISAYNE